MFVTQNDANVFAKTSINLIFCFVNEFNYNMFANMCEEDKELIFMQIMKILKNFVTDTDNLRIKYIKKCSRE